MHRKFSLVEIVHRQNCAFVNSAFDKLCTVQICDFCIWKIICAADLRILCTTVFRTFAHLHIYVLHICTFADLHFADLQKVARTWKSFFDMCRFINFCFCNMRTVFCKFHVFCENLEKAEKVEIVRFCPVGFWRVPENVRKKLTCSWVVHEWFLGQRVWQHRVAKVARICIN